MAFAKFQGNRLRIDGEGLKIMRYWLIIFNLTASIGISSNHNICIHLEMGIAKRNCWVVGWLKYRHSQ